MAISEPNLGVCRFKLPERLDLHFIRSVWPLLSRIVFITMVTSESNIPKNWVFQFYVKFHRSKRGGGTRASICKWRSRWQGEIVFWRPSLWSYQNFHESRSQLFFWLVCHFWKARNSPSGIRLLRFMVWSSYRNADVSGFIGAMLHWCLMDDTSILSIP